jgi:hypothetical protein
VHFAHNFTRNYPIEWNCAKCTLQSHKEETCPWRTTCRPSCHTSPISCLGGNTTGSENVKFGEVTMRVIWSRCIFMKTNGTSSMKLIYTATTCNRANTSSWLRQHAMKMFRGRRGKDTHTHLKLNARNGSVLRVTVHRHDETKRNKLRSILLLPSSENLFYFIIR